jgi:hypothetical protein
MRRRVYKARARPRKAILRPWKALQMVSERILEGVHGLGSEEKEVPLDGPKGVLSSRGL